MGDPPNNHGRLHRGGGHARRRGIFKKNGKGRTDIAEGGNGMSKGPEAGFDSVWREDIESRVYIFSFHSLIHPLLRKYFLLKYNLFPQLC